MKPKNVKIICLTGNILVKFQHCLGVNDVFNTAMVSLTKIDMRGILATYNGFKYVNTLVDVGESRTSWWPYCIIDLNNNYGKDCTLISPIIL